MKLSIIIPHYNEGPSVITPLLDSIRRQVCVDFLDFEVVIVNDGVVCKLSQQFLNKYRSFFHITYAPKKREGVSAARNHGLMRANGDYVIFCDCDDVFFSVTALYQIFSEIEEGFDYLDSPFFESGVDGEGKPFFVRHEHDGTFIHGKVFRRRFLTDNGLFFEKSLVCNEDSNFMCRTRLFADAFGDHKYLPEPFYLWQYRAGSVCREEDHDAKTYQYMIYGQDLAYQWIYKRNLNNVFGRRMAALMAECFLRTYFACHTPSFVRSENLPCIETLFAEFYAKYKSFCNENLVPDDFSAVYRSVSQDYADKGIYSIYFGEGFIDWTSRISAERAEKK